MTQKIKTTCFSFLNQSRKFEVLFCMLSMRIALPVYWVCMKMQTGVRKLVLHFHKIHLNKRVSACTVHWTWNVAQQQWKSIEGLWELNKEQFGWGMYISATFLAKECFGDHKPNIKPNTVQGIIGIRVPQLSKNLLNSHIHLPKGPLVNPCFIQNVMSKKVFFK